ncbi:MAG: Eco57I restriction-modification methylase domain-containing protein [Dethiosulfatibacter sp.]|nr:Eco57I restriction-modification methylase domain-containing protein [Dethiosulfatibacter sp.]
MNTRDFRVFDNEEISQLITFAKNNQFFHWELEFPEVFEKGGFEIAIGNPPYVDVDVSNYQHVSLETLNTRNLFSFMLENSIKKCKSNFGFIIPISSFSSNRMKSFQSFVKDKSSSIYISSYGTRPSKIFFKVEQRVSIVLGEIINDLNEPQKTFTTNMQKWFSNERKNLFKNLTYEECIFKDIKTGTIPKIYTKLENSILGKIYSKKKSVQHYIDSKYDDEHSFYYHSSPGYWLKALDYIPEFYSSKKGKLKSSKYKPITVSKKFNKYVFIALVNSSLFYWYWVIFSDGRDIMKKDILEFPFDYTEMTSEMVNIFEKLAIDFILGLSTNSLISKRNLGEKMGEVEFTIFKPKYNKEILDRIDEQLGVYFKFTKEELDFVKDYDFRLRLGDDIAGEDE